MQKTFTDSLFMSKIQHKGCPYWFQLLLCVDGVFFSVLYHYELNMCVFWTVGQYFEGVTLDFGIVMDIF